MSIREVERFRVLHRRQVGCQREWTAMKSASVRSQQQAWMSKLQDYG